MVKQKKGNVFDWFVILNLFVFSLFLIQSAYFRFMTGFSYLDDEHALWYVRGGIPRMITGYFIMVGIVIYMWLKNQWLGFKQVQYETNPQQPWEAYESISRKKRKNKK